MRKISGALPKTIAVVRMATAVFSFFSANTKFLVLNLLMALQQYLESFTQNSAVSFYQPILNNLIVPHAVFLGTSWA